MQYQQASPQQVASQSRVGQNLANIVGNFMNQSAASKALGGLENDPEYQKAPFSQRASRLQQALQPLGEYGEKLYQQRLPIEQQRAMEQQQQQEQQTAGKLWESMFPERPMPQGIGVKDIINLAKVTNRPPPGGATGQPVPPPTAAKIEEVLKANPNANSEELSLAFKKNQIPPVFTSDLIESRRRREDVASQHEFELGKERRKRETDISGKVLSKADEAAEQLPMKESALGLMNDAIVNKDLSFWSPDNLAEATGIEGLRSKEGAVFKTAGKEYLLGNMRKAGARPNQWIEQQIGDAQAKIGRSTGANLSVMRALENDIAIERNRIETTNQLAKKYEDELGYVPRELGARVYETNKKFAENKQKELYNDLRAINAIEEKKPETFKDVAEGTPITKFMVQALLRQNENDPKKAREAAKKLGYIF